MRILITGGTGTLGREITKQLMTSHPDWVIVIYSRDEGKQAEMSKVYPDRGEHGCRYMIGDIRDMGRLRMAMRHCNVVIHTAALKMIDKCELDPYEAIETNVNGTRNVAVACIEAGVSRAIYIGTDKAPDPVSVYGRTKALAEDLWIHSNIYGPCNFVAVRYGNVLGANKSVLSTWNQAAERGEALTVTDAEATRFYWSPSEAAMFVTKIMETGKRGVTYIPKMRSHRIIDMARSISDNIVVTGWRCPEKTHEVLWTAWETQWVRDQGDRYALYPMIHPWTQTMDMEGKPVDRPLSSLEAL